MDKISLLPPLQATLNILATALMIAAYYAIRRNHPSAHRLGMIGALITSILFLGSYLIYHHEVGYVPFTGQGIMRPLYFTILFTHIATAAAIVPLVLITLFHALRGHTQQHRRIAAWTLPLWLYTSITGVMVYILVFRL